MLKAYLIEENKKLQERIEELENRIPVSRTEVLAMIHNELQQLSLDESTNYISGITDIVLKLRGDSISSVPLPRND